MAFTNTIPEIQNRGFTSVELANADALVAKDLVSGSTNGRNITTVTCYTGDVAPGNTDPVILETFDGTTATTIYTAPLQDAASTQVFSVNFSDLVIPSGSKLRARVINRITAGTVLKFCVRYGDY